ncbi:MAG: amidohydrolase family protein [Holophagaceae bacterium]|jgi:hypothetical protein
MNLKRTSLFSLLVLVFVTLHADDPRTYFIKNIKVVPVSGPVLEQGSVLISDGLILAVGTDLKAPSNAQIINGEKLIIYPGFFDAYNDVTSLSSTGTSVPGVGSAPRPTNAPVITGPSDRPSSNASLALADDLRLDEKKLEAWRNGGFTHMHLVAKNALISSRTAVVTTAPNYSDTSLLKSESAIALGFSGGRDFASFPNSLMGSIAYFRQTFTDLPYYEKQKESYLKNPNGLVRPKYDKVLEGLSSAKAQGLPLIVPVTTKTQMARSLDLMSSFGFNLILQGVQEGYQAADLMGNGKVGGLVSLKWPVEEANTNPEDEPNLRTLRFRDRAPSTPSVFEKNGILFGFSGDGITSTKDFMAAIKLAVDRGLSKEGAIQALTLNPAKLLGLQSIVGSIEKGKIANLVITDGEPWESKTKIKMVFIDGFKFDVPEPLTPPERPMGRPNPPTGSE